MTATSRRLSQGMALWLAAAALAAPADAGAAPPAAGTAPAEPGQGERADAPGRRFALGGLVRALKDRDEQVRAKAAEELGRVKPKAVEAVPDLIRALEDKASIVRYRAAESLERIGTPAARKAVLRYRRKVRKNKAMW